jgi:hypothetical protein
MMLEKESRGVCSCSETLLSGGQATSKGKTCAHKLFDVRRNAAEERRESRTGCTMQRLGCKCCWAHCDPSQSMMRPTRPCTRREEEADEKEEAEEGGRGGMEGRTAESASVLHESSISGI